MSDEIKNPNTEDEEYQPDLMTLEEKKLFRFKIRNSELLPSISGHIHPEFPSPYPVKAGQ